MNQTAPRLQTVSRASQKALALWLFLTFVLLCLACTGGSRSVGQCPGCPGSGGAEESRIWPIPGELFYAQIGLSGVSLGEAAVVVGTDGTTVLIDVGNDSHDDDVREWLDDLVGQINTTSGFQRHAEGTVDIIVLTHYHADHSDGVADLSNRVDVNRFIVHRGLFDIGQANLDTVEKVCQAARENPSHEVVLCEGRSPSSCDPEDWTGNYPAQSCSGWSTSLGDAQLDVWAVNGIWGDESREALLGPFVGDESNIENARSMVGWLSHGNFRLVFAGDLTGGGSDTDDIEGFFVPQLATIEGVADYGVDVLHAGHHGRDTSSSQSWVDLWLPADGRDRNVVAGISRGHVGSPHEEVLDRMLSENRLGDGFFWATTLAPFGEAHERLVDADGGAILIRTEDGGRGYVIQAIDDDGEPFFTRHFSAVRSSVESP